MKKLLKILIPVFLLELFWRNYWRARNLMMIIRKFKNELSLPYSYEVVRGPLTFNEDGLATQHNCDFLKDPRFIGAYNLGESTGSFSGYSIRYRAYIACWIASTVKHLEGDFVECGVYRGGLSRMIIDYINFNTLNKKFYLFDTFNGLVEKYIHPEEKKCGRKAGGYEECYNDVVTTFKGSRVEIIKGTVPDTLSQMEIKQVCYLSLDMNCLEPELAAINFFWDKLVQGAIVLLDDYGFSGYYIQKKGFDEFAKEKGVSVLTLPSGQGLILKN